jgi:hypothetical protein
MGILNKPVIEESPLGGHHATAQPGSTQIADRKISSSEHIADRPVRNYFSSIILILMALMAFAVVIGIVFFHYKQPHLSKPGGSTISAPSAQH